MRLFSYNGKMEYQKVNDSLVRANYQHYHVLDIYKEYFEGKNVLDAGCWTGTLEKALDSRDIKSNIIGIDVNSDALATAKEKFPHRKFYLVDLVSSPESFVNKFKGYFDTAVLLDVIEHVPVGSEVQVLKTLKSLLRKDGFLILSTMINHPINFIDPAWFFGHRHYSEKAITAILEKAEFKNVVVLKIGNIWWDLDLLALYIAKHIFRKEYKTPKFIYNKILRGLDSTQKYPTRIYLVASS